MNADDRVLPVIVQAPIDGFFMGHGFTSGGQVLGSVLNAAVCKIQASKCYMTTA